MTREAKTHISRWLKDPVSPLVVTGTRQCGKTSLIKDCKDLSQQFIELDLKSLGDRIFFENNFSDDFYYSLFYFKKKDPRKQTLVFLDNVSESPNALSFLKKAGSPSNISVIAASANEVTDLPALRLYPLSFLEFLSATEEEKLAASYLETPYPPHDFNRLLRLFHLYTLLGGMPEVVGTWVRSREIADLPPVYEKIHELFLDEADNSTAGGKIRERAKLFISNIFPYAANRISFNDFGSSGLGSRESLQIFKMLEQMLLAQLVYPEAAPGKHTKHKVPERKRHSPRLHLPDTGIVNYMSAIQARLFEANDLLDIFNRQIAVHVTGQELLSSGIPLSFWIRSKPQSQAEIDFIFPYGDLKIPVEVKPGEPGRLRSLFQYMDRSPHPFAVRLWSKPLMVRQTETLKGKKFFLLNLPYFLAGRIGEYLPGFIKLVNA